LKIKLPARERGIAIIIAMVSIFALGVLAGAFAFNMKVETKLASNSFNETQLQWAGRSGVDFARWVLSLELLVPGPGQRYDSLGEAWAGGSDETNEMLSGIPHSDIALGPGVSIKKWSIVDNERKFNVNMALGNPQVLQKALINVGADVTEVPIIMASIQDWIDADNDTRMGGAETEYYQTLDPPYVAKNGPIDDLSELLLIKGIRDDPELYWGSDATNHSSPIFQNRVVTRSGMEAMPGEQRPGLKDLFTPISSGAINLLTASENELQVLPNVDTNIAQQIVQLRTEVGENGSLPYNGPADLLVNTSLGSQLTQQVAPYCTLRSSTFEITVVVQVGMSTRTYFALVRRNTPRDIPILNMRWEDGDQSASSFAPPPEPAQP
jgi:Type II secretion system (T2SS), protein K